MHDRCMQCRARSAGSSKCCRRQGEAACRRAAAPALPAAADGGQLGDGLAPLLVARQPLSELLVAQVPLQGGGHPVPLRELPLLGPRLLLAALALQHRRLGGQGGGQLRAGQQAEGQQRQERRPPHGVVLASDQAIVQSMRKQERGFCIEHTAQQASQEWGRAPMAMLAHSRLRSAQL